MVVEGKKLYLLILAFLAMNHALSQEKAIVFGKITDDKGRALELVNVAIPGLPGGTSSDHRGQYQLEIPANKEVFVAFSFIGYQKQVMEVNLEPGEKLRIDMVLIPSFTELPVVEIEDEQIRTTSLVRLDPKLALNIPTAADPIPALLKTLPGVSSANELSSQYSVRGGNFDENLIYVNDIEIYRPYLIRSGQQEGLSFVNADLVSSLLFSAGGFDAKYGDKMSSVLDLQYKKPNQFGGSFSASLLGGSVHVEGLNRNRKFSYLMGARYKSNQYILNAMETKGDYKPSFIDVQTLLSYSISKKFELSFLGNIARNQYKLVPETRETDFGTVYQPQRLTIYFDGQEIDHYLTYLGGITLTYTPDNRTSLKIITSGYRSIESESYDVIGQYWIGRIESDLGSENFGNVVETMGVGTYMTHARNNADINVFNVSHTGTKEIDNSFLRWGVKYQHEYIDDRMNEWILIDSAGYSLPRPPDSIGYTNPLLQPTYPFELYDLIKTKSIVQSNRFTGYLQNTWGSLSGNDNLSLTAGLRFHYLDYNNQLVTSPRATFAIKPDWETDILFRLSAGLYYQPPFYRELKNIDGTLNPNQKAQSSFQVVLASDLNFMAWDRPFKFISEAYYKYFPNLIPYLIDNVRIRYYSFDNSKGYATGIDLKVNGEFVRGIESWASLSIMSTKENIAGDYYYNAEGVGIEPGLIPRPSDQRVNFSIFFQDYLPMNPTYSMNLTLLFGSSLPFGPPNSPKYQHTLRMPPYRRVDIGFSKEIIGEHTRLAPGHIFRSFQSLWVTLEVLNLLQVNNTVSYIWVTDIYGRQYAVPNYLTPRQVNLKLMATF